MKNQLKQLVSREIFVTYGKIKQNLGYN